LSNAVSISIVAILQDRSYSIYLPAWLPSASLAYRPHHLDTRPTPFQSRSYIAMRPPIWYATALHTLAVRPAYGRRHETPYMVSYRRRLYIPDHLLPRIETLRNTIQSNDSTPRLVSMPRGPHPASCPSTASRSMHHRRTPQSSAKTASALPRRSDPVPPRRRRPCSLKEADSVRTQRLSAGSAESRATIRASA
jgi:hypothetical protein